MIDGGGYSHQGKSRIRQQLQEGRGALVSPPGLPPLTTPPPACTASHGFLPAPTLPAPLSGVSGPPEEGAPPPQSERSQARGLGGLWVNEVTQAQPSEASPLENHPVPLPPWGLSSKGKLPGEPPPEGEGGGLACPVGWAGPRDPWASGTLGHKGGRW